MNNLINWLVSGSNGWWHGILLVIVLLIFERMFGNKLEYWLDTSGKPSKSPHHKWIWLTAPGVVVHELGHALMVIIFMPLGFRVDKVVLFNPWAGKTTLSNGSQLEMAGYVQWSAPRNGIPILSSIAIVLIGLGPYFSGWGLCSWLYYYLSGHWPWDGPFSIAPGHSILLILLLFYLMIAVLAHASPSKGDIDTSRYSLVVVSLLLGTMFGTLIFLRKPLPFNTAIITFLPPLCAGICSLLILLIAIEIGLDLLFNRNLHRLLFGWAFRPLR